MAETRTPKQIAADKVAELIEKLEKAERPRRDLDVAIADAVLPQREDACFHVGGRLLPPKWAATGSVADAHYYYIAAPHVTTSLDAAVALAERVLPGWSIFTCLGQTVWPDKPPCSADVGSREFQDDIDGHDQENSTGFAPTLPLALCLAILKAVRAHMHPRDREETNQ